MNCNGRSMPSFAGCLRSTRITVAPRSASSMAHIGPGPMPANSTTLIPESGPAMSFPPLVAHELPLLFGPVLHGAGGRPAHPLHPAPTIDDHHFARDIAGAVTG
ncbi:hypothetical protein D3C85_1642820 [compost metagenome]